MLLRYIIADITQKAKLYTLPVSLLSNFYDKQSQCLMFKISRLASTCASAHRHRQPQCFPNHYLANMHTNTLALFSIIFLIPFCNKTSADNTTKKYGKLERQCIDYYQTGNDFILETLIGKWYAVYMWPVRSQQRDKCMEITFKKLSKEEIRNTMHGCEVNVTGEIFIQGSYKNAAGKIITVTYYGDEEDKCMFRSCDNILKYIFIQINENYVLGINCSSQGRGILFSKFLPTKEQVDSVVLGIEIMRGREGRSACALA